MINVNVKIYFETCLAMLNTEQFVQLQKYPTSSLERKVQRTLRKIKQKLPTDVYAKLYPNPNLCLHTNVPIDRTTDIILEKIYSKHEITTNTGRKEMKELNTLCTKSVAFTFNNDIYQ